MGPLSRGQACAVDVGRMLAELRKELDLLNTAIASLERVGRQAPAEKEPDIRKAKRPTLKGHGAQPGKSQKAE